jgi:hypothetical protein
MSKFVNIIIFLLVFILNISVNANHLKEGQVVSCEVIEHAMQSFDPFDDRVYSNDTSFQFRIVDITDEGGFLELSNKGKELIAADFLQFKFDHYHNDSYTDPDDAEEIRGITDIGAVFSYEDNNFVYAFAHAKLQGVEYIFAECDGF